MATLLNVTALPSLSVRGSQNGAPFEKGLVRSLASSSRYFCPSRRAIQNVLPSTKSATLVQRRTIIRSLVAEEPSVDNSTVLVVGGGGVALATCKALSTAGSWVTLYNRSDKYRKDIEGLGAMLAIGDALDPVTIEKVFQSNAFDAVVVTVGGGMSRPEVDKDGPINFVEAAKKAGVKRFVMVSSIGTGNSKGAVSDKEYSILEKVLVAKGAAEEHLKASGLDYTIIRPGGLLNDTPTGKGVLTEDEKVVGIITRQDVASLIFKILFDKRTISKTLAAIDIEKDFPGKPADKFETLSLA